MNGESPVIQEEGPVAVGPDELEGFLRHAVFDVFTSLPGEIQFRRELPRRDVTARRSRPRPVRQIHVEALLERAVRLRAEMPLAEMAGGVARGFERLGERVVVGLQPRDALGDEHLLRGRGFLHGGLLQHDLRQMAVRRSDAEPRGVKAGEDAGARRRAERVGGVSLREAQPAPGEALDVRRLVEGVGPVEGRVAPAEIVGEDEHEVGPVSGGGRRGHSGSQRQGEQQCGNSFHKGNPNDE